MVNNKHVNKKEEDLEHKDVPADATDGMQETVVVDKVEYEQLKEQAEKAKESWDRALRQQADFENIRKRLEREKQEFQKFAHEDIIIDFLEILDD